MKSVLILHLILGVFANNDEALENQLSEDGRGLLSLYSWNCGVHRKLVSDATRVKPCEHENTGPCTAEDYVFIFISIGIFLFCLFLYQIDWADCLTNFGCDNPERLLRYFTFHDLFSWRIFNLMRKLNKLVSLIVFRGRSRTCRNATSNAESGNRTKQKSTRDTPYATTRLSLVIKNYYTLAPRLDVKWINKFISEQNFGWTFGRLFFQI